MCVCLTVFRCYYLVTLLLKKQQGRQTKMHWNIPVWAPWQSPGRWSPEGRTSWHNSCRRCSSCPSSSRTIHCEAIHYPIIRRSKTLILPSTRHWIGSPVHENANLGLIVPSRQRPRVQAFPVGSVSRFRFVTITRAVAAPGHLTHQKRHENGRWLHYNHS